METTTSEKRALTMKNCIVLNKFILLLILILFNNLSFGADKHSPLIKNGSFELWGDRLLWGNKIELPSNWNPWTYEEEKEKIIEFSKVSSHVKHGKYALKLKTHAKLLNLGNRVFLVSGKKYELSAYVKAQQKSRVIIKYYIVGNNDKIISLENSYELEADKWVHIKTIQTMPEDIKYNSIYLLFLTKGTYLVDNVELKEKP